ncbi:hypothetical protein ACUNWD_08495 [Sunxiuqinia sp. A32]|uniref:hypothetical protein n=1 Tax=Sunxiuqinia sp. A32 TaxID=3461496 RepID=UPI0040460AE9
MTKEKTKPIEFSNDTERDIIELIRKNGKCLLGDILMKLKLSYQNGSKTINNLMAKDITRNTEEPPYFTLNN